MSYMLEDKEPNCPWMLCAAGLGLVGRGHCFLNGEWDNPKCSEYIPEVLICIKSLVFSHLNAYVGEVEQDFARMDIDSDWELWA